MRATRSLPGVAYCTISCIVFSTSSRMNALDSPDLCSSTFTTLSNSYRTPGISLKQVHTYVHGGKDKIIICMTLTGSM